jgi:hypothetical protein
VILWTVFGRKPSWPNTATIPVLSWWTRKNHGKISATIAGVLAGIRTEYLPNKSLERYRYTSQLGCSTNAMSPHTRELSTAVVLTRVGFVVYKVAPVLVFSECLASPANSRSAICSFYTTHSGCWQRHSVANKKIIPGLLKHGQRARNKALNFFFMLNFSRYLSKRGAGIDQSFGDELVRFPAEVSDSSVFHRVETGPGGHPASSPVGSTEGNADVPQLLKVMQTCPIYWR